MQCILFIYRKIRLDFICDKLTGGCCENSLKEKLNQWYRCWWYIYWYFSLFLCRRVRVNTEQWPKPESSWRTESWSPVPPRKWSTPATNTRCARSITTGKHQVESSHCGGWGMGGGGVKIQGTKEEAFALVKNAGIVILFWRRS